MNDVAERLTKCFSMVFPKLTPEEIQTASGSSVAEWDSLATLTLFSVIEEEFSVAIDFEDFDEAPSFAILLHDVGEALENG